MLVHGTKTGASIWFILWGRKETVLNMSIYTTPGGLKSWVTGEEWQDIPVVRLGKIELTETGPVEKIFWTTRERGGKNIWKLNKLRPS